MELAALLIPSRPLGSVQHPTRKALFSAPHQETCFPATVQWITL